MNAGFEITLSDMQSIDVGALPSVPMQIVSGAVGRNKVRYAAQRA